MLYLKQRKSDIEDALDELVTIGNLSDSDVVHRIHVYQGGVQVLNSIIDESLIEELVDDEEDSE